MKKILKTLLLALFVLTSCVSVRRSIIESYRYELYIDFKNTSYQGENRTQKLYLEIDSTNGMWYHGKLVIDSRDTIRIRGFEKGSNYPTTYKIPNTEKYGGIDIWCR